MRNIDRFTAYESIILARLHESFPLKIDLDVDQISGFRNSHYCREGQLAYATIGWLEEEGYIDVGEPRYPYGFRNCVLTPQGLTRLQAKD